MRRHGGNKDEADEGGIGSAVGRWVMSSMDHPSARGFQLAENPMRTGTFSRSYVAANMTQSNNFTPLKLINTIDDIWKYAKVKIYIGLWPTQKRKSARESKKFLVAEHFMNRTAEFFKGISFSSVSSF